MIVEEIRTLLDTDASTGGDPMSQRRWTHQTAEKVAHCLAERVGITVSATVVRRLLQEMDYSLKSNKKCLSSGNSPYRDKQFGIIKSLREEYRAAGDPIISVDTKKKELIGLFKNPGKTWCRHPKKVKDHDFRSEAKGLASPYGIYDVCRNFGVLVVGESADTPEFAVNSILTWWMNHGHDDYPEATRLLILADSGGSNGANPRMWKKQLQDKIADQFGLTIRVAHYPSGASKWNPIEHRLLNEITRNWAGHPLETFDHVVEFARKTVTKTGLHVESYRDERIYKKGKKVSDKEMGELALTRADEIGKWNYTIEPRHSHEETPLFFSTHSVVDGKMKGNDKAVNNHDTEDTELSVQPMILSTERQENSTSYKRVANRNSPSDSRQHPKTINHKSSLWRFDLSHIVTGIERFVSAFF